MSAASEQCRDYAKGVEFFSLMVYIYTSMFKYIPFSCIHGMLPRMNIFALRDVFLKSGALSCHLNGN